MLNIILSFIKTAFFVIRCMVFFTVNTFMYLNACIVFIARDLRKTEAMFVINEYVTEGLHYLHLQTVDIESVTRIGKYEGNKKTPMKNIRNVLSPLIEI